MSDDVDSAIGGYFELELPYKRRFPYPDTANYQSARAAFSALIQAGKPGKIWMPRFICDSMIAPLKNEQIGLAWYDVNDELAVDSGVRIGDDDWLLYVNYFGICSRNVAELIKRFSPDQLVFDFSQAFFEPPVRGALATIYSPRKFFGVPDGGLLVTDIPISSPRDQDTDSIHRMSHLLKRLGEPVESGYRDFQSAECSLMESEPKQMSRLTSRILSSIDFDYVRRRRRENFLYLHENLSKLNRFPIELSQISAPLCYPFATNEKDLRDRLTTNRVFVATYWPEAIARVSDEMAVNMLTNLIPLPVDQRYGTREMRRIVSIVSGGMA